MEACWYTPAITIYRMQKAYLENHGEEQSWGKSRLDKITEQLDNIENKVDAGIS